MARFLLTQWNRRSWDEPETDHAQRGRRAIRKSTVNLLGAAALVAAGLALLRQGNDRPEPEGAKDNGVPPGEKVPANIRLERLRELGI
ncbi:MAG: hypothetical protein OXU69_16995 [Gemmatimonadota bacterium]|nr:hypothetical protein [Gemmatimonadota bacterium]MDE2986403.1 hypothetical protein [Gemmatimonadota bacterium]